MFRLEEYRAAVSHKTEIRESNRGAYTVFDYVVALKDTFDSPEARNARGIAFDNVTGEIISLPYDKFHNYNECEGWLESDIDLSKSHDILEKLDGSMIRTIRDDSDLGFHFGTRAGVTDVSKQAEKFLFDQMPEEQRSRYFGLIEEFVEQNTLIFEYCAPTNQIVVFYPQPQLVLTAIRQNSSGLYMQYDSLVYFAGLYGVPVVQRVSSEHSSIGDLADRVKEFVGSEGVVVRFHDGKMVKMKGLDYVQKHRALEGLRWEKDVLTLIFNNQIDDVLPLVDDTTRARLVEYREDVLSNVRSFMSYIRDVSKNLVEKHSREGILDRKAYREGAMEHKRSDILMALIGPKQMPKHGNWQPFSVVDYIVGTKYIISSLRTQETVDDLRDIIGPKTWYAYGAKINVGDD